MNHSHQVASSIHIRPIEHPHQPMSINVQEASEHFGVRSTMYRELGAHPCQQDGVDGTHFAVWAPNAREVAVICNRNGWHHGQHLLYPSDSGIWRGFYPNLLAGEAYKYSMRTQDNRIIEKADPYAFRSERRPQTASVVADLNSYAWHDDDWLNHRATTDWFAEPISIYEVQLASWRRPKDGRDFFDYSELADMLIPYCQQMGYTHLQLMPITEYPFDGSWGYQVTGYFAPTSRFGSPDGMMRFIDRCHQANIGVFVDWVPGHFPNDAHGLGRFDGTALYEHEDPRKGVHPDWGTYIYNYARNEVREFLLSSARFWCDRYHIDGIRVDAVASMLYLDYSRPYGEWLPNQHGGNENLDAIAFIKDMNTMLHREFPGILTIAEESTSWTGVSKPIYDGGLGFTMKWDMGWMNDSLKYMRREPIHRTHHQNDLSFRMMYAFSENFVLPLSHDEVVHGKRSLLAQMPGDIWQQFANLRMLYCYQFTMPGKKLQFMGSELAQWKEWNHDAELDWALCGQRFHDGIRRLIGDLNRNYKEQPALHQVDFSETGFRWIECDDAANSIYAFIRLSKDKAESVIVACNFTPIPRTGYRLGVPTPGFYKEFFNSDADCYGGSNTGNSGGTYSESVPIKGFSDSITVTLPPLGVILLKPL